MKILHIGKYFPPFKGGIENFMSSLIDQQVKDGHQVSVVAHHHEPEKPTIREKLGAVHLVRVKCYGALAYAPMSPTFGRETNKLVDELQPDIIHIHMPNLSAFWCLFSKKLRAIPWVVHWHSDVLGALPDVKLKLLYPFYQLFERALLKSAKAIIATSPNYLENSKPLADFHQKTHAVALGLPKNTQHRIPRKIQNEELRLLTIGRLTYYKGHSYLIEAIQKLTNSGVLVHLDIVGIGELEQNIQNQIIDLGVTEQITMHGRLEDEELYELLEKADLLCLPSIEKTEAFGVVLLEAASFGIPALVSDVPGSGMSWVVQHMDTGIVVKAQNVESLAERLTWASKNREKIAIMGAKALERFRDTFQIVNVSEKITKIYRMF
ncbi:glycosyltransferase [Thalassotalea euphylliae]|uniref:Glycosyltransferase n=1 Tax=Thalassotalea euphylliae TaxID=1655234 RepID=A0A3E0U0H5_9GAMM|nr:glycosyltransferase [Thalassotalea euphylliae]REL30179.1 glycosyltransferase [Thalassotalea euphylliae]